MVAQLLAVFIGVVGFGIVLEVKKNIWFMEALRGRSVGQHI